MHVTAIVPAYNTFEYIAECLDSILDQTHDDFDILVVDDGSSDLTEALVSSYLIDPRISLVSYKPHRNVTYALATGIRYAFGPIITIVDSDDKLLDKSIFKHASDLFQADTSLGFAWSKFICSTGKKGWSNDLPSGQTLFEAMSANWWSACHQKFFRKSVYNCTIGLNSFFDRAADFQLVYLLATTGCKVQHIDQITYWYRRNRLGSISSDGSKRQRNEVRGIKRWIQENKALLTISS